MGIQKQPTVQELKNNEDLQLLQPEDVVEVNSYWGDREIKTRMVVVKHPEACCVLPNKLSLAHRISSDGIYHINLPLERAEVRESQLMFDYSKGEAIRIWGRDWIYYDELMKSLEKANLE